MEKVLDSNTPRVLVSTVPSWGHGSDTLSSLFKGYDKEKLASLYLRADKSDCDVCERYYHIFEGRVLKSILKRKIETGEEYYLHKTDCFQKDPDLEIENKRFSFFKKFHSHIFSILREFIWILGRWKTHKFEEYLDSVNPEVFVFPIESYIHFNKINEYIIKSRKPKKIIGFLWDDNFTYKQQPYSVSYKIHRFWLRHSVKRLVKHCNTVFVLSPKMKREVDSEYKINSVLLTKPIIGQNKFKQYAPSKPIRILYTGKLIIGRDKTISKVVKAIKEINSSDTKVFLDIYTGTKLSKNMFNQINAEGCCKIHKPIKQSEVFVKQQEADVLLFAESLSNLNKTARLSFSTKLTDYFSVGKCIWGIGNKDLGPIEYLKETDSGLISTYEKEIKQSLSLIVNNKNIIKEYAQKSFNCGIKNHNATIINKKFKESIINKI